MKLADLNHTQRFVLSVALPAIGLVLAWPVNWAKPMRIIMNGKIDDTFYLVHLRDQPWFWATTIAVVAAWLCILWQRSAHPAPADKSLSDSPQQATSAEEGARG